MKHISRDGIDVYRIGFWTHRWWPRKASLYGLLTGSQIGFHGATPPPGWSRWRIRKSHGRTILRNLKLIRRPHRPWQAEYDECRWCPRAWTAQGARRKAERDLAYQRVTGRWAPWIQRKVRREYGPNAAMGPKTA